MPTASRKAQPAQRMEARSVDELLSGSPYVSYSYSYPHKTAYRELSSQRTLRDVWSQEPRNALFLYIHVPFCAVRCGFCNLLATTGAESDDVSRYLSALEGQGASVREAIGKREFVRFALGGGTPTFLSPRELDRLLAFVREVMGADLPMIPAGIEVSPETTDADRLEVLRRHGIDRVSIGVQSFDEQEARAMGRPQNDIDVRRALTLIREHEFSTLNIDLIYGGAGQTVESWLNSLREALAYRPEELYLYPLYVRPLTGLGLRGMSWDEQRLELYRAGRDFLLAHGYEQVSMRMFRAGSAETPAGPVYCCQQDGMVGLGAGARSYTKELHYSTRYAVGKPGVRGVIDQYVNRSADVLNSVDYGFELDDDERRRRYLIQSMLLAEGLDVREYRGAFGTSVVDDFAEISTLERGGLAVVDNSTVKLTAAGLERSDAIGPWLYSSRVGRRMEDYEWA